jgi:mannosyl-oligosaccharide glucosidase
MNLVQVFVFVASVFLHSFVAADVSPGLLNAISAASNSSLLWGPYRPNLYFGVRPRLPKSLLTGLLWANVDDYQAFQGSLYSWIV